jgi:hypothetical protein
MGGRTALVKSVLASQAIYHLTPLPIAPGTLKFINKLPRAFIWAAKESASVANCKINREVVCRPNCYGGLGVLHLEKFAMALRLRWPWLEWNDPDKIRVGSDNPCSVEDMDIFFAATTITIGNGCKTPFWHAPWLHGKSPKDVASLIFASSKRKNWKVAQAMIDEAWVQKINIEGPVTSNHLLQFMDLWVLINNVQLEVDVEDTIVWKFTESGTYSASSAYKLQFLGLVLSNINTLIWKAWATPKAKNHAWLAIQNRLWTAERLQRRGWPNCGLYPLRKQTTETTDHLFVIMASPLEFGSSSWNGLGFMGFIQGNGRVSTLRNGGHCWLKVLRRNERLLLLSRCLPFMRF